MVFSVLPIFGLHTTMVGTATTENDRQGGTSMDFDQIVDAVRSRADDLTELNHSVLFDLEDEGKILIDATSDEVVVTVNPDDEDAETTLVLSSDNLEKLIAGDLNPMVAFTMGKLKIFGSKGVALKLSSLLEE
jgi:putative sterol carrier protein